MKRRIEVITYDEITGSAILSERNVVTKAHWIAIKCKYCKLPDYVVQYGKTDKGTQRYYCHNCQRTFIDNNALPHMQYPPEVIASAINHFYESSSLTKIERQLRLDRGQGPDFTTVYKWVAKYTKLAERLLSNVSINVGDIWLADETVIGLKSGKGENIWVWDIMCQDTRFMLASHLSEGRTTKDAQTLMRLAEKRADKIPYAVITDKLRSYIDAIEKSWGANTEHIQSSPFAKGKISTRGIERLHGSIKDRTKVIRALANKGTAKLMITGWSIHYNFFRPHQGLGGKTPAQVAGVKGGYLNWSDIVRSGQST